MSSTNATITDIELIKSYVRNKLAGETQTQATSIKGDEADDAATEVRQKTFGN
jgi:hypothetical protein